MNKIPTRKERRAAMKYQGMLAMKKNMTFSKWSEFLKISIKNGIEIFKTNESSFEKSIAEQLEAKELIMIENWKENNYNDAEIKILRGAYATLTVKYLPTWHDDKKVARNLIKEVNQTRTSRING